MNIVLWILQILLALMFLMHGRLMLFLETSQASRMPYVLAIPTAFRRFIGVAEVLGALGLILPALTNILPWLTPLASTGLVAIMIGGAIFHFLRRENPNIVFNLILLVLAAIVAYGRFILLAPL